MRKIIDGKRYSTDNAQSVYGWTNGHYGNDSRYRSMELYRTPGGAWFLYHVGGPSTDMAQPAGDNGRRGGEDIERLDDDAAYAFLEARSSDPDAMEAIEEWFADRVEEA